MIKVLKSKLEQFFRLLLVNFVTPKNDSILVVEYPKSGGTWLGQLVSGYFDIPFPRNKFPTTKKSVFHGHYLPNKRITKNRKIILLVRDGRDVMISLYHHQLIWNEKNKLNPKKVDYYRKESGFDNFEDVKENMGAFIDFSFTHRPSKLQHFTYQGNWQEFNAAWLEEMGKNDNIFLITYEELLEDTSKAMRRLITDFFKEKEVDADRLKKVVEKFSFERQTNRQKGDENASSFLRKGISGDWKNYFGDEEKRKFKNHTGDMLVALGYENDVNW